MTDLELEPLKFPIGRQAKYDQMSPEQRAQCIDDLAQLPERLVAAVENLTDIQLDTPYRPEGWTVRQVVHHLADSHMNGFIRAKLMLTEDFPTVKPYKEALWAELVDSKNLPIASSLQIISAVHYRWVVLLNALTEADLSLKYYHPQYEKEVTMLEYLGLYSWHSNHHLAHITRLKERMEW